MIEAKMEGEKENIRIHAMRYSPMSVCVYVCIYMDCSMHENETKRSEECERRMELERSRIDEGREET